MVCRLPVGFSSPVGHSYLPSEQFGGPISHRLCLPMLCHHLFHPDSCSALWSLENVRLIATPCIPVMCADHGRTTKLDDLCSTRGTQPFCCCRLQQRQMPSWQQLQQILLHVPQSHSSQKRRRQPSAKNMTPRSRRRLPRNLQRPLHHQQPQPQTILTTSAKLQVRMTDFLQLFTKCYEVHPFCQAMLQHVHT